MTFRTVLTVTQASLKEFLGAESTTELKH